MPLSASDFGSALKAIGFLKSEAEAEQAWTDAWQSYITNCTQVLTVTSGVSAFKVAITGAFAPTSSKSAFFDTLKTAMEAGINALVLKTTYGTIVPTPAGPLGYSPQLPDNDAQERDALADKVNTWTKTFTVTGVPPTFATAGPLS